MRQQIAAANWKMNLTADQGVQLLNEIKGANIQLKEGQKAVFAVPFPYLSLANELVKEVNGFEIAAQNCSDKKSGAYTGEVAVDMLKSIAIPNVIIGHSERREYFAESNEILAEKVNRCLEIGLTPIFCCGEALPIREANTQNEFVATQIKESLFHLTAEQLLKVVIAYEPIWAIGTGKTASAAQAQEMHASIRATLTDKYGADVASEISILYGGSVKAANAVEIFSQPDVDGGLVGGASLIAAEFVAIIKALK